VIDGGSSHCVFMRVEYECGYGDLQASSLHRHGGCPSALHPDNGDSMDTLADWSWFEVTSADIHMGVLHCTACGSYSAVGHEKSDLVPEGKSS